MDIEQRRHLYMDIQRKADAVVGVAKGMKVKKSLPKVDFAIFALRESLPAIFNGLTVENNCAKMFILLECGYSMKDIDGKLYVGIDRPAAKERGRVLVNTTPALMRAWATLEEAINS